MGVMFFQNGAPLGGDAGWGGFTGNNNYVVRYDFVTGSEGASQLAIVLSNIFYGHGAGTQSFGFMISTDATAYSNIRATQPHSNRASMTYSQGSGYACTLWAVGLNLLPATRYYIFVYLAGEGTEYYTGWNCVNPQIVTGGSYCPPVSTISSISSTVSTGSTFTLIMQRSGSNYHKASFLYGGNTLAVSPCFASSLSYTCPREWLACDIYAKTLSIEVSVQSYSDAACTKPIAEPVRGSFSLTADRGMCPSLSPQALSVTAVNSNSAVSQFVAGISRARVVFDALAIDMSACAGAEIAAYSVSCRGKSLESSQGSIVTESLNENCTLVCTVRDSRGCEGSVSIEIEVFPYVPPSLTDIAVQRCNAQGEADENGDYWKLKCSALCSDIEGNSCTVKARLKSGDIYIGKELVLSGLENGVWSDCWERALIAPGDFSGESCTVLFTVTDSFNMSRSYTLPLYKLHWAMKFNSTGTAVGFGMAPEHDNALQIPEHWHLYAGVPILSPAAYGTAPPELAINSPKEGQIYLRIAT